MDVVNMHLAADVLLSRPPAFRLNDRFLEHKAHNKCSMHATHGCSHLGRCRDASIKILSGWSFLGIQRAARCIAQALNLRRREGLHRARRHRRSSRGEPHPWDASGWPNPSPARSLRSRPMRTTGHRSMEVGAPPNPSPQVPTLIAKHLLGHHTSDAEACRLHACRMLD